MGPSATSSRTRPSIARTWSRCSKLANLVFEPGASAVVRNSRTRFKTEPGSVPRHEVGTRPREPGSRVSDTRRGPAEAGPQVAASVLDQDVVPRPAVERVDAGAAVEDVVAGAAAQHV